MEEKVLLKRKEREKTNDQIHIQKEKKVSIKNNEQKKEESNNGGKRDKYKTE